MSIKSLNYSFITDFTKDSTDIEGRRIKRFKPEYFQSFNKTMNVRIGDIFNDFRFHDIHKTLNSESYNAEIKSLLINKKLYLVLDLDHTLLNTIPLANLTLEEEYLKYQDHSKGTLFRLDEFGIITKLRPFVHQFLQEANKLFEMCIYTMGSRAYALTMAKILDPENKYFKSRIISKDDFPKKNCKGLDVLRLPKNLVLILDDTEAVWQNHKDNLILMDKYVYFQSSCHNLGYKNCKSLSVLKRDENESDGLLATILRILRRIHHNFFEINNNNNNNNNLQYDDVRDVRQVLKTAKKDVLKNCKIVFSAIFPRNFICYDHRLWKMAEELGATCTTELDSCVTHVVSIDRGTKKSVWAVEENKYLVHPRWIEAAYYLWRRQLEHKFPVPQAKPTTSTLISNLFSQ